MIVDLKEFSGAKIDEIIQTFEHEMVICFEDGRKLEVAARARCYDSKLEFDTRKEDKLFIKYPQFYFIIDNLVFKTKEEVRDLFYNNGFDIEFESVGKKTNIKVLKDSCYVTTISYGVEFLK